jgi:hypothetical protein
VKDDPEDYRDREKQENPHLKHRGNLGLHGGEPESRPRSCRGRLGFVVSNQHHDEWPQGLGACCRALGEAATTSAKRDDEPGDESEK